MAKLILEQDKTVEMEVKHVARSRAAFILGNDPADRENVIFLPIQQAMQKGIVDESQLRGRKLMVTPRTKATNGGWLGTVELAVAPQFAQLLEAQAAKYTVARIFADQATVEV